MKARPSQAAADLLAVSQQNDLVESGLRGLQGSPAPRLGSQRLSRDTLGRASGRGRSSSSPAAITIQLTSLPALRTQAERAALLTHPQAPATVYIS